MLAVKLFLAVQLLSQTASTSDPTNLVDQLGSARYADREAAARALEQLGREAVPALQLGRGSRDLEVRSRAESILRRIEGSLLTQPTMVRLDFRDAPLPEVVSALVQRTGMKIALFPENFPRWKTMRVNLREPEAMPFWKAIDRLCQATSLHGDLELHGPSARNGPTLALGDRNLRPLLPTSDHGPFRVSLVGLDYQRHVGFAVVTSRPPRNPAGPPGGEQADLGPPRPRPVTSVQCTLQLQVTAEPRLGLSQSGPLQIKEAVDDRGNSLVAAGQVTAPGPAAQSVGYLGGTCTPVLHLRAPLHRPDNAGASIRLLTGKIPLAVMARRPDPLVVPLAGASGKTFGDADVRVTVHEVRTDPNNRQRQIELSVQPGRPGDAGGRRSRRHGARFADPAVPAEPRDRRRQGPRPALDPDHRELGSLESHAHARRRTSGRRAQGAALLPALADHGGCTILVQRRPHALTARDDGTGNERGAIKGRGGKSHNPSRSLA